MTGVTMDLFAIYKMIQMKFQRPYRSGVYELYYGCTDNQSIINIVSVDKGVAIYMVRNEVHISSFILVE